MKFAFLNNFSSQLSADMAADATTMTLDSGVDDLTVVDAREELACALTLVRVENGEETHREIVYVTATDPEVEGAVTVLRGQEGTTALDGGWPSGTKAEMRLTAGIMDGVVQGDNTLNPSALNTFSVGDGATAVADHAAALGLNAQAVAPRTLALGSAGANPDDYAANEGNPTASAELAVAIGAGSGGHGYRAFGLAGGQATSAHAVAVGTRSSAYGDYSLALGRGASAYGIGAAALGVSSDAAPATGAYGDYSLALQGGYTSGGAPGAIAIGLSSDGETRASANSPYSLALLGGTTASNASGGMAIGPNTTATGTAGIAIGTPDGEYPSASANGAYSTVIRGQASGDFGIAIGSSSGAHGTETTALGTRANATSARATAIGSSSGAYAPEAVALGYGASASIPGTMIVAAISTLPKSPTQPDGATAPESTIRSASQIVLTTAPLDLSSATAEVSLALPSGIKMFIDKIDVVVETADTPAGTPAIVAGYDATDSATLLAATEITGTAAGNRQRHDPLDINGAETIRVATATALTGGAMTARIVFHGYAMEV